MQLHVILGVTFISANANPPVQYLITLTKQDEVSKIKHHLTKVVSDEIKHPVVVGEVFDHHIAKILVMTGFSLFQPSIGSITRFNCLWNRVTGR